jgi:signal transduction histidine kinase
MKMLPPLLALLTLGGPAFALDIPVFVQSDEGLSWLAGAAIALLGFVGYAGWHRLRTGKDEIEDARVVAVERLEEILSTAPDGYFLWDHPAPGQPVVAHCSRRLAVLLALPAGTESTWADVRACFHPPERDHLDHALARLNETGERFELEFALAGERRWILLMGARTAPDFGTGYSDVVWMREMAAPSTAPTASGDLLELKDSFARLRNALDALPLPIWVREEDLGLTYCNRAYALAVEAESAEAALAAGLELLAGADLREGRALAARARAAGEPRARDFHIVVAGRRQLARISESPVRLDEERLITIGCAVDLSRQEEVESELSGHIRAHADVLERLATAIAIFGPDTRLAFYNTAFTRLWGLDPDWLGQGPTYGQWLDSLRDNRRLPEVTDFRAYKEEEMKRFTSLISPVEGVLHLPDDTTLRRVIAPHPFGGLLLTFENVTDALALERSFNTSIAVHRETLDHLSEGIAVFGADGRLRLWNPALLRIWSLSEAEVAGGPHVHALVQILSRHFPDAAQWERAKAGILAPFAERLRRSGRIERDKTILDFSAVPLPDGATMIVWLDVSDTARVERALMERNDALSEANRLKSQFLASVSAEVRNPLNAIVAHAEMLLGEYYGTLNARQRDYAQGIAQSSQAVQALIEDILDLAAIEAGAIALSLNVIDIHAMLSAVLRLSRERVREKRLTLNFDCPLDIGWMVADERRIRQILFNLLSNAVQGTPSQGQITLAAQRDGGAIIFTVADTGGGIPEDQQQAIFEKTRPDGAGLGLTLVKRFVELHGGNVEIASVVGEGTTIICKVPAGEAH